MSPKQVQMLSLCKEAYTKGRSAFLDNRLVARKMQLANGAVQISLHLNHDPSRAMYLALFDREGNLTRFVDCSGGRFYQFVNGDAPPRCDETMPTTPQG